MGNALRAGAVMLACTVIAGPAVAQGSSSVDQDQRDRAAIGGGAVKQPDGLWRVHLLNGEEVTTHGADVAPDPGTSIEPGDPDRAPVCASDASAMHIVYGRPSSVGERGDARAQIEAAVRRMNALLHESAVVSGSTSADYEVHCDRTGAIRIDTFTNSATGSFRDVVNAMLRGKSRGPNGADHLIFYDGPADVENVCGVGTFHADESLSADNANNVHDGYSVVYQPCWDGRTPMHENGHNMGAVQTNAPNSTGAAHCAEVFDVMCYRDGGPKGQVPLPLCPHAVRFDCGYDTYFDAAPETGEYLSTNWNIGSRLNSYIRFGG